MLTRVSAWPAATSASTSVGAPTPARWMSAAETANPSTGGEESPDHAVGTGEVDEHAGDEGADRHADRLTA